MRTVIAAIVGFFGVLLFYAVFVIREGGKWRFGFKLGKYFQGGASGSGRGAHISRSVSTQGGATALDKTGHSSTISDTSTRGDLKAEVSDEGSDEKKKN